MSALASPADISACPADRRAAWMALRARYLAADAAIATAANVDDETMNALCERFRTLEKELLLTHAPDESSLREKFAAFREFLEGELDFSLLSRPALASIEADALLFAAISDERRSPPVVPVSTRSSTTTDGDGEAEDLHRKVRAAIAIVGDLRRKVALVDLALAGREALGNTTSSTANEALSVLSLELGGLVDRLGRVLGNGHRPSDMTDA